VKELRQERNNEGRAKMNEAQEAWRMWHLVQTFGDALWVQTHFQKYRGPLRGTLNSQMGK